MGALILFPGEERFFTSLRTSVRVGRKVLKDSMEEQAEVGSVLGWG